MALLLILVLGLQVGAQWGEERPSRINVKAGLFRPSSENLRTAGGSVWTSLGVEYVLDYDEMSRPVTFVSLERVSEDTADLKASFMPISYTRLWRKNADSAKTFYYGAGAGIYFLNVEEHPARPPLIPVDESKISLGFTGIVGYDVTNNLYAELRYTKPGKVAGIDLGGLMVCVGTRNLF